MERRGGSSRPRWWMDGVMRIVLLWLYMCDILSKGGDLATIQSHIKPGFIEDDSALRKSISRRVNVFINKYAEESITNKYCNLKWAKLRILPNTTFLTLEKVHGDFLQLLQSFCWVVAMWLLRGSDWFLKLCYVVAGCSSWWLERCYVVEIVIGH